MTHIYIPQGTQFITINPFTGYIRFFRRVDHLIINLDGGPVPKLLEYVDNRWIYIFNIS